MKRPFSVISFFAGVGGIDLGFSNTGDFTTVYANEFDFNAQTTFACNFGDKILDRRDIHEVNPHEGVLGQTAPDVLTAGFPCQAFSIAGYRKGFDDERGDLFFETMRMVEAKRPPVVMLENVKNLVTHDSGNTFTVIREYLIHAGYYIKWAVLNASEYGNIPQNRERIYVVGFTSKEAFEAFEFPPAVERTTTIRDVIDFKSEQDNRFYYTKGVQPFYSQLHEVIKSPNSIYQWRRQYVRENKSGVVPTLTANMGTGGHNVPLIRTDDERIRKLTPRETFSVQGFPSEFKLPNDVAYSQLYKQAGNSVAVPVIERIAKNISSVLKANYPSNDVEISPNTPAIMQTELDSRMSGSAFPIKFFNSTAERKEWVESSDLHLPLVDNTEARAFARLGKHIRFLSLVG